MNQGKKINSIEKQRNIPLAHQKIFNFRSYHTTGRNRRPSCKNSMPPVSSSCPAHLHDSPKRLIYSLHILRSSPFIRGESGDTILQHHCLILHNSNDRLGHVASLMFLVYFVTPLLPWLLKSHRFGNTPNPTFVTPDRFLKWFGPNSPRSHGG